MYVTDYIRISSLFIEIICKSEKDMCEKALKETNIHFVRDLKRVVFKSYIISLYTCIDATFTFVCVYEILRI